METKKKAKKKTVKKTKQEAVKIETDKPVELGPLHELDGKFMLFKVGDNDRPATDEDIADIQNKVVKLFEDNNIVPLVLVTHHAVRLEIFG